MNWSDADDCRVVSDPLSFINDESGGAQRAKSRYSKKIFVHLLSNGIKLAFQTPQRWEDFTSDSQQNDGVRILYEEVVLYSNNPTAAGSINPEAHSQRNSLGSFRKETSGFTCGLMSKRLSVSCKNKTSLIIQAHDIHANNRAEKVIRTHAG